MRKLILFGAVLALAACKPDPYAGGYGGPGYAAPGWGGGWGQPRVPTWVDQAGNIHTPYTTITPVPPSQRPQWRGPWWSPNNPYRPNNDPGGGN